jgi:hypothetical protein
MKCTGDRHDAFSPWIIVGAIPVISTVLLLKCPSLRAVTSPGSITALCDVLNGQPIARTPPHVCRPEWPTFALTSIPLMFRQRRVLFSLHLIYDDSNSVAWIFA